MAEKRVKARQMPLWALVVAVVLLCVAAFSYGFELHRDMAVSDPEFTASIVSYMKPLLFGSLVGAMGLCIWCSLVASGRAEPKSLRERLDD